MPTIIPADAVRDAGGGTGWSRAVLADRELIGTSAMTLERLTLDPGAEGAEVVGTTRERFLYVIRGSGEAASQKCVLPLEVETVVWLEPGDHLRLRAGDRGLQVLIAEAGDPQRGGPKT